MIKLNYHSSQKRLTDINKKELSNSKEDIIWKRRKFKQNHNQMINQILTLKSNKSLNYTTKISNQIYNR